MRIERARITNYRSVHDSGWIDIEHDKTILVGPNEAGKTALLQALQQINPPPGVAGFSALRDYPRSHLEDLDLDDRHPGLTKPAEVTVIEAHFELEEADLEALGALGPEFGNATYIRGRRLDNTSWQRIDGGPAAANYGALQRDLQRIASHADGKFNTEDAQSPSATLAELVKDWLPTTPISAEAATGLAKWLQSILTYVDEHNQDEEARHGKLVAATDIAARAARALEILDARVPVFIYFSNYFRVRPRFHLQHLADRVEQGLLDDDQYDRGNLSLLKLLGFTARELSDLGRAVEPPVSDADAKRAYEDQLDTRHYRLNAASVRLTEHLLEVWQPDPHRAEADRLRIEADQQYLKVVVEDELGVEVELDQRSEGFQWLVSFFVVFFAEAMDAYKNAVLLLDEPGLSLHGLKLREFRRTLSRLAAANQTIYTTHSPFLVGPDELDIVRVVEMTDRKAGTKARSVATAGDPAALLPLQEALGYDLAQSLFAQQRNLVFEGLTDYWYVDATAQLLAEASIAKLDDRIALTPAHGVGMVVYFATILRAQGLNVAALLDSEAAGESAARQDTLVNTLGNRGVLRTKDAYVGSVNRPKIEDLLRNTLCEVALAEFGYDAGMTVAAQPHRSIVDIFAAEITDFSRYRLAKAYLRWTRSRNAFALTGVEREQWSRLIAKINATLQ